MRKKLPGREGFSLLEILLGSVLFATVLVYLAGIWGIHARVIGHTRSRMIATFIAGQQIENCITAGFRGVDILAAMGPLPQTVTTTINGESQSVDYSFTIQIQPPDDPSLIGRMKVVIVTVQFNENSKVGGKSEVVYRTMLSDI